jgi:hypothetical protein
MSLASGTRTRPPQSGFVQTGFWEVSVRCGRLWLMLRQGLLLTSLLLLMRSVSRFSVGDGLQLANHPEQPPG